MEFIVSKMSEVFKALGDPTRLKIIKYLASGMVKDLSVTELAKVLNIKQPAASQHIKVLKTVGILEPTRNGQRVQYTINLDELTKIKEGMNELFELAFIRSSKRRICTEENK